MLEVNTKNIICLLKMGLIKVNLVYPITRARHFRLETPLSVTLTNGEVVTMPRNFEFDGSSTPRMLWWLFPSYGDFFFASLIHDFLYHRKYKSEVLGMKKAQKFADYEMLRWSNTINKRNFGKKADNYLRFKAVRWFGKKKFLD